MLTRLGFDAISAAVLALTALLGAYTPAYLAKRDKLTGGKGRSMAYVLGNMLSAGVMVSAGFCHLLGEALLQMRGVTMRFPLAPFLCAAGYLLTLVADKIATLAHGGHRGCAGGHSHGMLAKGPATDSCCVVEVLAGMEIAERGGNGSGRLEKHSSSSDAEGQGLLERTLPRNGRLARQHSDSSSSALHAQRSTGTALHARSPGGAVEHTVLAVNGSGGPADGCLELEKGFEVEPTSSPPMALAHGGGADQRSVSFLTAVLMGVALCFHSLLEGGAMGAQSTIGNSLHIFIAIVSHKGLAAYALGSSIVDSEASMQGFWSVVLPFMFASPVGIFIGYVISDIAKGIGAASISALASGTFLYVAFMEVIPKELKDPDHMALKIVALLTGFALMSLLAIWA